ncbi:coiled-coil domain-containing protein 137 [Temnothorax longispinosus]|uniref:coiled-coil domain-containing protein 137 n=1 Tax=Temnothorax longispinosus TaxID=300112 RepID=UPI003A99FCC8
MGRKIPGKKHRGVKDPEKQRAKRMAELELCTNTAPKNVDEQAIPKSLERVIKLKEAAKTSGNISKRKRKKKNALICVGLQHHKPNPKGKPEKVTPVFQQRPGESGRQFMHRVSKETHDFLKEIAFEKKYGVQIERDSNTGEIQGLTKCKREKDDVEALQAKHKNITRKKKVAEPSATLTKSDKRKLKLRMKKEKELENRDEFERLQDKVIFGEVAHEPPRLKIKSKKMDENRKPKNLLLSSLLESPKEVSSAPKVINRSGKRKHLPETERRRLEKRQSEAIAAYRQLKSQRLANRSD